ncbi:MAG: hypothetical protein HUK07_04625, partial [Bacteroidaceae bacterium]|nr:hypothetical protein [Bacteroidaceae bacterium]
VIKKTAEVPAELLTPLEDIRTLSNQLMLHAKETHSLKNMAAYHFKKPVLNTGQFLLRYVDIDTKEKVKKLFHRVKKS